MNMNKQEVLEKVKKLKPDEQNLHEYQPEEWEAFKDGFDDAKCYAELAVEKLDEPEKPVLTKEEAEWLESLEALSWLNKYDALYYIVRQGFGHGFSYTSKGHTSELETPTRICDTVDLKARLVNALLYGYEVEKEKLYTVEIPNPNASEYSKTYLCKNEDDKVELFTWSHYTSIEYADNWKQLEPAQLTEAEIKEDFEWAWQFAEEVEE